MRVLTCTLAGVAMLMAAPAVAAEFAITPDDRVVGNLGDYVVQAGDNLADIARHFDIGYTEMLAANPGVDPWTPGVGRKLTVPALFILPDAPRRGIVINLAERRLYYFPPRGNTVQTYPIGIGAIGFTTPLSTTTVVRKEPNPVWIPPASIREEQPDLPASIGPGPDDPLGDFALRLGWTNYLLHGTNKPDGVGRNVSHGCIHLYPEDIEQLFKSVAVGTPVRAVEQPAAAAWMGIGLYVEVHPTKDQTDEIDTEQAMTPAHTDGLQQIVSAVAGQSAADGIDWGAVDQADMQRTGLPVEVAQRPPGDTIDPQPAPAADETVAVPLPHPARHKPVHGRQSNAMPRTLHHAKRQT
jgi:L,D-transpeptidase ErfK/SrfK